ncbi:MAG: protein TolR [Tagaea sp.]|nr:protein TolR [Azospirillum sp.]MCZ8123367.1 protein TolR [Magnetospirillum sp.]
MAGPLVNRGRRGPGSGRRRGSGLVAEINVTPFVDVMLVLLVIFMITAPLLTSTVPVDLPQTQAARATGQDEPLVVSVNNSGKVYLQDSEMELDVLVVRLRAITNNNTDARIFVRGDRAINYGRVLEVMGAISAAGFNKVALVAEVPQGRPAQGQQRR